MMDSMNAPASTAPMNFGAISSVSRSSCRTQKQLRHGGQRDGDPSSQRPDPSFKQSFLPHSPPSLSLNFGQASERQGGHSIIDDPQQTKFSSDLDAKLKSDAQQILSGALSSNPMISFCGSS